MNQPLRIPYCCSLTSVHLPLYPLPHLCGFTRLYHSPLASFCSLFPSQQKALLPISLKTSSSGITSPVTFLALPHFYTGRPSASIEKFPNLSPFNSTTYLLCSHLCFLFLDLRGKLFLHSSANLSTLATDFIFFCLFQDHVAIRYPSALLSLTPITPFLLA